MGYSITSNDSLEEAKVMYDKIQRIRDDNNFPLVLAGNKCDLESERVVKGSVAEGVVANWNNNRGPYVRSPGLKQVQKQRPTPKTLSFKWFEILGHSIKRTTKAVLAATRGASNVPFCRSI